MSLTKKFEEIRKEEKNFRKLSFLLGGIGACGLTASFLGLLAEPEQTPYIVVGGMAVFALGVVSSKYVSTYSKKLRHEYPDAFGEKKGNRK